ncbi:polysaccharide deacetylase family protein [Nocardioides pakistanensis]
MPHDEVRGARPRARGPTRRDRIRSGLAVVLVCMPSAIIVYLGVPALLTASADSRLMPDSGAVSPLPHPRPVSSDCSGGYVYLTFDDGPFVNTPLLLDRLKLLNLRATFFVVGRRVQERPEVVVREVREGHSVQNHTYAHTALTVRAAAGSSADTHDRAYEELAEANEAIVAAGAPRPIYYRPPYGLIADTSKRAARQLGLQLVMPFSDVADGRVIDSRDTESGVTTGEIVKVVTEEMSAGKVITMHDGARLGTINSLNALQAVADRMNALRLCSSTRIPRSLTEGNHAFAASCPRDFGPRCWRDD